MSGWGVIVYRQAAPTCSPARGDTEAGTRIAIWETRRLTWLRDLLRSGHAIDLGGNGYPCRVTVEARHLVPILLDGPPDAVEHWAFGAGDIITKDWAGKTLVDMAVAEACLPEEWLLVELWDES